MGSGSVLVHLSARVCVCVCVSASLLETGAGVQTTSGAVTCLAGTLFQLFPSRCLLDKAVSRAIRRALSPCADILISNGKSTSNY